MSQVVCHPSLSEVSDVSVSAPGRSEDPPPPVPGPSSDARPQSVAVPEPRTQAVVETRSQDVEPHMDEQGAPIEHWASAEDEEAMPDILQQICDNGARIRKVPQVAWRVHGGTLKLRKNLKLSFSLDMMCSTENILKGMAEAGVITASISAIQRRASTKTWVISFQSEEMKELALEIGRFSVCGCPVHLYAVAANYVIVKVYEAPPEMPDTAIIGRLSAYGKVITFRRDRAAAERPCGQNAYF